jgi:hypothetical protein
MRAYLHERHGIAPESVVVEEQSLTTVGNAYFVYQTIFADFMLGAHVDLDIVTSDFHTERSALCFSTMFAACAARDHRASLPRFSVRGALTENSADADVATLVAREIVHIELTGSHPEQSFMLRHVSGIPELIASGITISLPTAQACSEAISRLKTRFPSNA